MAYLSCVSRCRTKYGTPIVAIDIFKEIIGIPIFSANGSELII